MRLLLQKNKCALLFVTVLFLTSFVFTANANAQGMSASASDTQELGFKIGKLRLHPGLSLQNVFDTNVSNASDRYDDAAYRNKYPNNSTGKSKADIIHIVGSFKLNYPDDKVAVTLDLMAQYQHFFDLDDAGASDMSSITGRGRFSLMFFRASMFSFGLEDIFTRSVTPKQVGIAQTTDRIHNTAKAMFALKPGGGQLRFFLNYAFDFEKYDDDGTNSDQNWMQHQVNFDWELEFLPKTAVFMQNSFAYRDYYDFTPNPNNNTNVNSPNSMPFTSSIGLMGRITSKLLFNVSVGYGNTFSKNYDSFSHVLARAELIGQFTDTTMLKGGFSRTASPVTTYSWTADNKIYLEFKQWLVNKKLKLYLYSSYSFFQYGTPDQDIILDDGANPDVNDPNLRLDNRSDRLLKLTPSIRYDFLAWLNMEVGYTLSWRDTDYSVERINSDNAVGTDTGYYVSLSYYDYVKHEVFVKLTLAY